MTRGWLGLGVLALAAAVSADAPAATTMTSLRVSATVVARCTVAPGPGTGAVCLQRPGAQVQLAAPPRVTYARDSKTGGMVKTVEF